MLLRDCTAALILSISRPSTTRMALFTCTAAKIPPTTSSSTSTATRAVWIFTNSSRSPFFSAVSVFFANSSIAGPPMS